MLRNLKVVVVTGLPGTGKSTLAEAIATRRGWPVFSVDPIESAILRSGIPRSFETGLAAYLVAEVLAHEQLKLGLPVIIDAVSPVREAREMWGRLATSNRAALAIIECTYADTAVHRQRIEARVRNMAGIPEVTWEDVKQRRAAYLGWTEQRLVVDSADAVEHNLVRALRYIDTAK